MTNYDEKLAHFRALHQGDSLFIAPNAWDAGSALILQQLGYPALATTSAGFAFSQGVRDSSGSLTRAQILDNAKSIVSSTHLPVSGDLENGFGASPAEVARTVVEAQQIGLCGGAIEDASGDSTAPIYDFSLAVERIYAAVEAKEHTDFMLTARAENFIYGKADLDDTIKRLQAFEQAGADVLYAPGLPDIESVSLLCSSVSKPVNVVIGLVDAAYTVEDLAQAGVRRISVGGSFARAALGAFISAAQELRDLGTSEYSKTAISDADASAMMRDQSLT